MIRNPAFPGDPVYDMAFNLYAMEEEGLLPTHRGCLNKFCDIIKENNFDADDYDSFQWAEHEAGIDWELSYEDWEYIKDRIGQRSMESTIDFFLFL